MKKWGLLMGILIGIIFSVTAMAGPANPSRTVKAFTLKSDVNGEKRLFVGSGGKIDGQVNPTLFVNEWDVVEVTLINTDGLPHHLALPDFFILSREVKEKGEKTTITFVPFKPGGFAYFCDLEGHRKVGMEGQMVVVRAS
ncbi:MAG: cupredoxin domain-containing protein [Nitrospirae bacterium]|nr:cupredoxin domain-containing protein [Candidatus Manganitrophaceae bacterium]